MVGTGRLCPGNTVRIALDVTHTLYWGFSRTVTLNTVTPSRPNMTRLDTALALTGVGTVLVGLLLAAAAAYTGTVLAWIDSIGVLLIVGLVFASGSRLFTPTVTLAGRH